MKHVVLWITLLSINASAYVHNLDSSGSPSKWGSNNTNLNISIDVSGYSGSQSSVYTTLTNAINNWNNEIVEVGGSLTYQPGVGVGVVDGVNTISFSSDLGSGVLGVTLVTYNANSNEIKEADIIFNSNNSFYLDNVFRHELGHFLGLGHSEVMPSLMVYYAFNSHNTVHSDDRSGVISLYGSSSPRGSISGKVNGVGLVPVYGAHVQAISVKTGTVFTGVISDKLGKFKVEGLDPNDNYYLYVSPTIYPTALPSYYKNIKTNFCPGSYVGKFFTQCSAEEKGKPQAISVGSSADPKAIDVGTITIGCDPGLNSEYVVSKTDSATVTILNSTLGEYASSYVGYFYPSDLTSSYSISDNFKIDLSSLPASVCPGSNYANCSVQVNLLNKQLGSPMQLRATLYPETATIGSVSAVVVSDGYASKALSSSAASRVLLLKVEAKSDDLALSIPDSTTFRTNNPVYLISVSVRSTLNMSTVYEYKTTNYIEDNLSCLEAPYVYQLKSATVSTSGITASKKNANVDQPTIACGTIDDKNFPPMNGGGFLVIFAIPLLFAIIKSNKVLS